MKTLLVGINSKFIHSNLAIRYIQRYAAIRGNLTETIEYTINQSVDYILDELIVRQPDVVLFSCYIWNIEYVKQLSQVLKKVCPDIIIGCGGPEVSYDSEQWLLDMPEWDVIIRGEGEEAATELIATLSNDGVLDAIMGLTYRKDGKVIVNPQGLALDMADVPFPYDDAMTGLENRILYYETSRGCPYSCEYCLSSIEKGVRFRPLSMVFDELKFFLDKNVKQVKFVDRTFNAKKSHAMAIWQYLKENDNGYTNFHFELTADLLDETILEFLKTLRVGLVQFEVGVQSTNEQTIVDINRKINFDKLKQCVLSIKDGSNIHLHLDLIAGLPGETYASFGSSFNDVMSMRPEQLQLGFLKVLRGSMIHKKQASYKLIYRNTAPYEILITDAMSYMDLRRLHHIEEVLELYYNSEQFSQTIEYLMGCFDSPFECFEALALFFETKGLFHNKHNRMALYEFLLEFAKICSAQSIQLDFVETLLLHDLASKEKPKKFPGFHEREDGTPEHVKAFYRDEANQYLFSAYDGFSVRQIQRMTYVAAYHYDIMEWMYNRVVLKRSEVYYFYDYREKEPLTGIAKITRIDI